MARNFTLEYWIEDEWYVGKLKEIPGVFSQGESLEELEENIQDAYKLMMTEETPIQRNDIMTKELELEI
ncbi:MAG: type II toxin-antitoxin system HicB family antitoxin [bacterium]